MSYPAKQPKAKGCVGKGKGRDVEPRSRTSWRHAWNSASVEDARLPPSVAEILEATEPVNHPTALARGEAAWNAATLCRFAPSEAQPWFLRWEPPPPDQTRCNTLLPQFVEVFFTASVWHCAGSL
jgi:hypothetical protein